MSDRGEIAEGGYVRGFFGRVPVDAFDHHLPSDREHRPGGREERERGHDDLACGADADRLQRQRQRVGAARDPDRAPAAEPAGRSW